jgi:hypothetical protein
MYSKYFDGWNIRPEYRIEFICIFDGWLGKDNLHKLDDVTVQEWGKFNKLLEMVSKEHDIFEVNCEMEACVKVNEIGSIIQTYEEAMKKDSDNFIKLILPKLDCVISEDWDYTYILWHKNGEAVSTLDPLVRSA